MSANPPADVGSTPDARALLEAERSGWPFLLYRDAGNRQRLFFFTPGSVTASVGRAPSSDLLLGWDERVSRVHARFERADDAWMLVDDGLSTNGTFVNEERLNGRRGLNDGDILRFGETAVTFRSPAQSPAPATVLSSTQRRVLVALCRPYQGAGPLARPATDDQIAEELFLAAGEVRAHLRVLSAKLGLEDSPDADARARLAQRALSAGLVSDRDL